MNFSCFKCATSALLALCCAQVSLYAQSYTLTFGSEADLEKNFSYFDNNATAPQKGYAWSADARENGSSGRLNVNAVTLTRSPAFFSGFTIDLNNGPATASFTFLGAGQTGSAGNAWVALGLHTSHFNFRNNNFTLKSVWTQDGGSSQPPESRFQIGSGTGIASENSILFEEDRWYEMRSTWTLAADGAGILVSSSIWEYGTETSLALTSVEALVATADLFDENGMVKPLYLGVMAQLGNSGAKALGSISVSGSLGGIAVPEPATLAALLAGAALATAMVLRRRRR